MSRRIDYYNDPSAPKANSIVPSANVIVVNDAFHPLSPHLAIRTVRENRRILERYAELVVEPIANPSPNLLARAASRVHVELGSGERGNFGRDAIS